jgi:NADPH:quinone reductase-like Zn-dependent oxidoreductase
MRAVHLTAFGNPVECLEFVQIQDPPPPGPGQVLIGVEFSPINLNDLLVVRGTYPLRPSLPSVIGNEGVGRILAVGPGVQNVTVGDRVLTPLYGFAWPSGSWYRRKGCSHCRQMSIRSSSPC